MKGWVIYSAAVTIVAVAGVSFAVGVIVTGALDDDGSGSGQPAQVADPTASAEPTNSPRPEPTEYRRLLTGTEAAEKVRSEKNAEFAADLLEDNILRGFQYCEAVEFNEFSRSWVVQCPLTLHNLDTGVTVTTEVLSTWLIDDLTSQIEGIGGTPGPLP